jgi:hypothetical protein
MAKFKDNPEGYSEQIKTMREEKKTYAEIRKFFKETYGIVLYDGLIAKIAGGYIPKAKDAPARGKRLMPKGKSRVALPADPIQSHPPAGPSESEFAVHIHEAFQIHKRDFIGRVQRVLAEA